MEMHSSKTPKRTLRFNTDRFFHVMGEGWFFEAREGINGPFGDKESALATLTAMIEQSPRPRAELWL